MTEYINAYIKAINQRFQTGQTTEHSFRGDLEKLVHDCTGYLVINEPSHGCLTYICQRPSLLYWKIKSNSFVTLLLEHLRRIIS